MNDTRTAFTIPKVFFDDHLSRELAPFSKEGILVKELKYTYTLMLTEDDVFELLSDSDYYSDIVQMAEDTSYLGLQSSARATHKRILKQLGYASFRAWRVALNEAAQEEEGTR